MCRCSSSGTPKPKRSPHSNKPHPPRPTTPRGTYEIVATRDYMVRPPMPVIHVFLIDVSNAALGSGATAAACQCVEQVRWLVAGL